ncbi:MAG: diaminopimelate epimerase [Syntrophomonadaceae bacterium]|nr:diaminopimelate epimerase [Syntrophomonadaceae bacterium]
MQFVKMHGLGNDFIVIEDESFDPEHYAELAVKWCDRHFGIGGDGLIVTGCDPEYDVFMRIFNSDGTEPEMCGNGIRCVARYAWEKGLVSKKSFAVRTLAGIIYPEVIIEDGRVVLVKVNMGEPILTPARIPVDLTGDAAIGQKLVAADREFVYSAVSMGNPHCVIFVDDINEVPVARWGAAIERHPVFPSKTNVEFVQVLEPGRLRMKVWERGAGETLACGTGACASLVAAVLNGQADRKAILHLDGGDLIIEWSKKDNHVFMSGPAATAFEGQIQD